VSESGNPATAGFYSLSSRLVGPRHAWHPGREQKTRYFAITETLVRCHWSPLALLQMKSESIREHEYESHEEAKSDISEFVDKYYNYQRLHSAANNLPPVLYEASSL
jgi:transposase InsO family protein